MSEETKRPTTNPKELLINIQGRDYLPVAARIHLFRERYPIEEGWQLHSERVLGEGVPASQVKYRAWVVGPEGDVVAEAIKTTATGGKFPAEEKAETGAYGRVIGLCGIGTLFAQEWDEQDEEVCDSPVQKPAARPVAEKPAAAARPAASGGETCATCGGKVPSGRVAFCRGKKEPITCGPTNAECPTHPKNAGKPAPAAEPAPDDDDGPPPPVDEEGV
jgi:hypothetical protein